MSSTLGAPLGGTTRGGHQGFDSAAVCLISPPKFGGTGGRALDVSDSVNAGDPGFAGPAWPLTGTCAKTATSTAAATPATTTERTILRFMIFTPSYACGPHQALLVRRRELRPVERERELHEPAVEPERHLVVAVLHRRAGVGADVEGLVPLQRDRDHPLHLLRRHHLAVDLEHAGPAP